METDIKAPWKNGTAPITINKEWAEMLEKENSLKWDLFSEDS